MVHCFGLRHRYRRQRISLHTGNPRPAGRPAGKRVWVEFDTGRSRWHICNLFDDPGGTVSRGDCRPDRRQDGGSGFVYYRGAADCIVPLHRYKYRLVLCPVCGPCHSGHRHHGCAVCQSSLPMVRQAAGACPGHRAWLLRYRLVDMGLFDPVSIRSCGLAGVFYLPGCGPVWWTPPSRTCGR